MSSDNYVPPVLSMLLVVEKIEYVLRAAAYYSWICFSYELVCFGIGLKIGVLPKLSPEEQEFSDYPHS